MTFMAKNTLQGCAAVPNKERPSNQITRTGETVFFFFKIMIIKM